MSDHPDDYMGFDKFITRDMITIIYFIGAMLLTGLSIVILLVVMLSRATDSSLYQLMIAVVILIVGNILWRFFCEMFAVIFKINDSLISIDQTLKNLNKQE